MTDRFLCSKNLWFTCTDKRERRPFGRLSVCFITNDRKLQYQLVAGGGDIVGHLVQV